MSHTRTVLLLCALCATAVIVTGPGGCGPTRHGMEMRSEARDRLATVNAQLSFDQARRAFETGQFERARREIMRTLEQQPDVPEYLLLKGRIFLELHSLERAMRAFTAAIEASERRDRRTSAGDSETIAKAHYFAGIVKQRWSRHRAAAEHYLHALEFDSTNPQYLMAAAEATLALGEYAAARAMVEDRLDYFEHNAALRHLLGQIASLQDDHATAARLLSEARLLSGDDEDGVLLEELAWAHYRAGHHRQALEAVRRLREHKSFQPKANSRQPTSSPGWDHLLHLEARCLLATGDAAGARSIYLELTRRDPGDIEAWIELGAVAWELGDRRRLGIAGDRIVGLAPDRAEGYVLQAAAARENQRPQQAVELLLTALERDLRGAGNAGAHLLLGLTFEDIGEIDKARAAYTEAMRINPHDAEAHALFSRLNE